MKSPRIRSLAIIHPAKGVALAVAVVLAASPSGPAATVIKADTSNLSTGADWTGGIAPGAFDIASFTTTISSGNESALTLGANLAWKGLQVGTVNGPITIINTGGFTLTIGTSGIDMSAATNNLTVNSNLTLRGAQSWSAASGKTLTVSGGTFTHTGATVDFTSFNSGATLSGITNDATGILGPWATTGTGTSLNYAANTAGSVAAATTNTTTLPVTGATSATNYTMTANTTMTTAAQSANTLRITGGTTLANGGFDLALNGLMNAGTTTNPTFSGAGKLLIGTSSAAGTNELVITAATTAMQISSVIANNGSSTGVLTLSTIGTPTGSNGRVIVSGANTYTGGTYINGNVQLNGNVANPLGTGTVTLAGGWLENGATINSGNLANSIVLAAGTTSNISLNGNFNFFVSGPLSGSGNLILGNNGSNSSLVLNGDNHGLTGTITVANNTNTVQLGNGAITNVVGANTGSASAAWVFNNTTAGKTAFNASTSGTYEFGSFTGVGTLRNNTASTTATVQVGALNLNDTFSGVLNTGAGAVALTKVGTGTQALTGTNVYIGATTVTAGTLALSGTGSINSSSGITINGSDARFVHGSSTALTPGITLTQGTLDGTGTVGAVTVGAGTGGIVTNGTAVSGTVLTPGTATLTLGSLTFNGAAAMNPNVSSAVTVGIAVTGALTTSSGTITLNPSSAGWTNGNTYNLISYGSLLGSGFSSFALGTVTNLGPRQSAILGNPSGLITLAIAGDSPKWTGAASSAWTLTPQGSPFNWQLITAGTGTEFLNNDQVLFDDTATGSTAVNISSATVNVTGVAFNNSSKNYSISSGGGFGIAGAGGLTKSGTGTVTLNTANTYTGGTTINAGTVQLGSATALGAATNAALAFGSGSTGKLQTNGNSITLTDLNTNATVGTPIIESGSVTAGVDTLTVNTTNTDTYAGVLQNGGTRLLGLTKSGVGSLTLSGANTYTGATTVNGGTLSLTGSLAGSNITVNGAGAVFDESSIGVIAGTGTTFTLTNGAANLAGVNTYTGGTTVNGGTLTLGVSSTGVGGSVTDGAVGTGTVTMGGGALNLNGFTLGNNITLTGASAIFNNIGDSTVAGNVSGSGVTLTTNGAATTGNKITNFSGTVTLGSLLAQGLAGNGSDATGTVNPTTTFDNASLTTSGAVSVGRSNLVFKGSTTATIGGTLGNVGATSVDWAYITIQDTANVTVTGGVDLTSGGATGALNLNGGTLTTSGLKLMDRETGTNQVSATAFNGTQIVASGNNASFVTVTNGAGGVNTAYIGLGGAKFNSNGFDIGVNAILADATSTKVTNGLDQGLAGVAGSGFLTKSGLGTLTLNAVNTYTGVTSVTGGTLAQGVANSINSASNISLTAAALASGGFAGSVGTLTINSGVSIFDLGAAGSSTTFNFADSSALAWSGTLNIYNWTAGTDHVTFGNSSSALTGGQLEAISFYSDAGTSFLGGAAINSLGEISAIPEPSVYGLAITGFLTIAAFARRRSRIRRIHAS